MPQLLPIVGPTGPESAPDAAHGPAASSIITIQKVKVKDQHLTCEFTEQRTDDAPPRAFALTCAEQVHPDLTHALSRLVPHLCLLAEQLTEGQPYTRAELRQIFDTADVTLETTVFRPSGYDSVWLFITRETATDPQFQSQLLDENTLLWSGQLTRHNQLVIPHEPRGLELLVFYRESPTQYSGAGFSYLGRFEYQTHTGTNPALFTLTRSGFLPSIEEIQVEQDAQGGFNPATVRDGREWVLAAIVRRRGQAAFRASLLAAYAGTCPVTGCQVETLLEAAHIIPYLGATTNHIQNGLPLRADIHTLFDLQLLAIDPDTLTVLLAPSLSSSEYSTLAGRPIGMPSQALHHPSRDALRTHRIRCSF